MAGPTQFYKKKRKRQKQNFGNNIVIGGSGNQAGPGGPGSDTYNPNLSTQNLQNQLQSIVDSKQNLQNQAGTPAYEDPTHKFYNFMKVPQGGQMNQAQQAIADFYLPSTPNAYQQELQSFMQQSPAAMQVFKERFPITAALNSLMEVPEKILTKSPLVSAATGILNALSNNNKKEKTISDTMFAYEQPLDVYKSKTTPEEQLLMGSSDIISGLPKVGSPTDIAGSSDIISGLPKVGSPGDTKGYDRLDYLQGLENKTDAQLRELISLTRAQEEKYKSPGLGAEAQSVDPLAVNIKPKQKPGIEQLIESMNRTLKSNTSIDPNYVSPSAVNAGTFTDGASMYVNPNVPTLYSDTNPFKLRIMGQDYDGIRSRLYDQGILNPNASSANALNTLNSLM